MAEGHSWGGASRAGSNHPALALASAAPPYPRRGMFAGTYVAVYRTQSGQESLVRVLPESLRSMH
jgi:hypothetical protein